MNENSALMKLFDKVLLALCLVGAAVLLYFSFQKPADVLDPATLDSRVKSIEAHRSSKQTLDLGYTFYDYTSAFSSSLLEKGAPAIGDGWMFYSPPTPREFVKVTITPPPPVKPELSPVAAFTAVSSVGQVALKWNAPVLQRDITLAGYYVFRADSYLDFGTFILDDKIRVTLGEAERLEKPIAGPLKTLEYTDSSIFPEKKYAYVIVAFGFPSRPVFRDGKPVIGVDGAPLMEIISDIPVASVSQIMEGVTVPEIQLFLTGTVGAVAANFEVFKWDRENAKWLQGKALNVAVGKQIVAVTKDRASLETGWVLHGLENSDKARNLDTAVIVLATDYSVRKSILLRNQREPEELKLQFAPVPDGADAKKP
ncbi:MAG: hypothetical protein Kow00107_04180 [Planctomycetota bacterium]